VDLGLAGRVAIVSGASQGIGAAIARSLALEGALVGMVARNVDRLDAASAAVTKAGGDVMAHPADMTDREAIDGAVDAVTQWFGRAPDIAVANVIGGEALLRSGEMTAALVVDALESLVLSVVHLVAAVAPAMERRGFGRVLNVSSDIVKEVHRELPMPLANMMRPAAAGFFKSASADYGRDGITFNTLAIGGVASERRSEWHGQAAAALGIDVEQLSNAQAEHIPVGRFGRTEEVGALAAFLCSEHAGFITGETIAVNGGRTRTLT
jgi:3-oxoacyl-[acyl-carrier protein] reductase